ncbi:HlyD family secretion protein [Photobacterium atrarenae]|uniref:HlyD family efflux transporter periplasmic adaptor subunit n=1 Tax=Photobacterium atrarenae TaxID=865757 RepID=A0ABY5GMD5_9GAMM|nr:HlyD family efflux transporter periplasmic adaptor subunit [Photobacterium atrarenae]UTV29935.1 HlyD family efflux transporter periplasmic adaptor subunit [Photobacterium atrarenae]
MKRISVFGFALLALLGCGEQVPSEALGTLERDRVTLTATSSEIVREQPIKEGEFVTQGQVLVKLDDKQQLAVLAKVKAEEAKAAAYLLRLTNGERPEDIAAAQASLVRAEATLREANSNYRRIARLVEQRLVSYSERDKAVAERDSAQADYQSARENLAKLTSGERPEDITQAKAALDAAQAEVVLQQQILDDLTVVATRDGVLDSLPYNVGERVSSGSIVAGIQADTVPYARVYVPEPYRVKLQAGDELTVHIDGLAQSYTGTLRWIATEPAFTPYFALNEQDRARLVYLAEVDLPQEAKSLPAGVPVQVEMPR